MKNSNLSKIRRLRLICMKFELDKSKFAQVRQFRANFRKMINLKKIERFNRFSPNSKPKVLY